MLEVRKQNRAETVHNTRTKQDERERRECSYINRWVDKQREKKIDRWMDGKRENEREGKKKERKKERKKFMYLNTCGRKGELRVMKMYRYV